MHAFHFSIHSFFTLEISQNAHVLGLQLPRIISNYPSVILYYPFLRGNSVTQIRVMVKPLWESQAQSLDL